MVLENIRRLIRDQRGIALPLALMVLLVLTGLVATFVAMGGMEPVLARAHKVSNQALPLADAGVERSIWALNNPNAPGSFGPAAPAPGSPVPNTTVVPAPYDGTQLVALGGVGGLYTMQFAPDPSPTAGPNDWLVTSVGYVLRPGAAVPPAPGLMNPNIRAAQKTLNASLAYTGPPTLPGGLTVAGSVNVQGNTTIDGNDSAPGVSNAGSPCNTAGRAGITIRNTATLANGTVAPQSITCGGAACNQTSGTPSLPTGAQAGPLAGTQTMDPATFNPYLLTNAQLAALKSYAQSLGPQHYIQPNNSTQMNLNPIDGLMFVDTVNGAPICPNPNLPCPSVGNAPNPNVLANVKITGANNSGWIIVMGSVTIDGNVTYNGFIYAANDISYRGTGTGQIEGAMMSANVVDTMSTSIDTQINGNAKIFFDCNKVKNPCPNCLPPPGYALNSGTWREQTN